MVQAMPTHLRPTAPIATDAILVGDPGRALLLAQELLSEPRMSNHARGLWGYSGETPAGKQMTIQSTGIGGPSAATVLAELAELGVARAVRVGTCVGLPDLGIPGGLLVVREAIAAAGSVSALGQDTGATVQPNAGLTRRLVEALGEDAQATAIASFDLEPSAQRLPPGARAADMQTASLFAQAQSLGIEVAAVLVIAKIWGCGEQPAREALEGGEKRAGHAAITTLSA
jgi:uridine phosphorylase